MASPHNQLLLVAVLVLGLSSALQAANDTTTEVPLNQALHPLYSLTDGFLHAVFLKGIRVDTIQSLLDMFTPANAELDVGQLVQTVLNGYAGFATCVVIGLLLAAIMPLVGLFCCCCRLFGKCGGKTPQSDPKNAKCKRIVCSSLLLIFVLITIGGMVLIFFSGARLYNIIKDGTINEQFQHSVQNFNETVYETVEKDIVARADVVLNGVQTVVDRYLDDAGVALTSTLLNNFTNVEQPVSQLAKALNGVNITLGDLIESMEFFEHIRNETEANFTLAQSLSTRTTVSGLATELQTLINVVDNLSVNQTITLLKTGVQDKLANIPNLNDAYKQVNSTVADVIQKNFNNSKQGIQDTVSRSTQEASNQLHNLTDSVKMTLNEVKAESQKVSFYLKYAAKYAKYGWYPCAAVGAVVALISLLYMCGLMFGCGERPGEDANFCNKGCGANFVLSAVGLTFIFYALLMLLTVALFFVGSLISSQVCWTINEPADVIDQLQNSDIQIENDLYFSSIINSYKGCLDGQPLGQVINEFNLSVSKEALTDMVKSQLKSVDINATINSINVDTSGLDFVPTNLNDSIQSLKRFNDFNSSVIPNMTSLVEQIKGPLRFVKGIVQASLRNAPANEHDALEEILRLFNYSLDFGLDDMAMAADEVKADIIVIEDSQDQLQNASETAFEAIINAQEMVKVNGTMIVRAILTEEVAGLMPELEEDISEGIDELFSTKCDRVAESLKEGFNNVVCVGVLHPLNGLWFSLGWSLIMLIPCIIVALCVASLFRREEPYGDDYKEDFSQYINHQNNPHSRVKVYPSLPPRNRDYDRGERIPLESYHRPYHHGDNTNQAFRDDYGQHVDNIGGGSRQPMQWQGSKLHYY